MNQPDQPISDERVRTTCLVLLTILACGAALASLRPVLVPLLLAVLLTYCLRPIIEFQVRHLRMPRLVAVFGAAVLALAALALCGLIVIQFTEQFSDNLPAYENRLHELMLEVSEKVPLERFGVARDQETGTFALLPEEAPGKLLGAVLRAAVDIVSDGGLVLVFVLFLLFGGHAHERRPGSLLDEIESRAQTYILQMVGFSVATGFLVGTILWILGVPYAFTFGFIAFLLNFIPTIGPLAATLLPLPVVLLTPDLSLASRILAIVLPAGVQCTFAVIQPRVQGKAQELHPVTTLAALVFFGSIWGIIGAGLAVPVTGVIKIVLSRIPNTRPLARWMAGKVDLDEGETS